MTREPRFVEDDDLPRDEQRVRFTLHGEDDERTGVFYAVYTASPRARWAFVEDGMEDGGAAHQSDVASWRPAGGAG